MECSIPQRKRKPQYRLPSHLRPELRKPLGVLFRGTRVDVEKQLARKVKSERAPRLVAVGDRISATLEKMGVKAGLYIVDGKVKRRKIPRLKLPSLKVYRVKNPAGVLTDEAFKAVKKALRSEEPEVILVDGEEDLLTLPAILYAPEESLVLYGQPGEGVVAVKVSPERKKFAERIVKSMKEVEENWRKR